jgi:hypothetical protein
LKETDTFRGLLVYSIYIYICQEQGNICRDFATEKIDENEQQ